MKKSNASAAGYCEGSYPYVWVDATYLKARQDGRVASTAVVRLVGSVLRSAL